MIRPDLWLRSLQQLPLSNTERALLKLLKTIIICGIAAAATELVNVLASPGALTIGLVRTAIVGAFLKGVFDAIMKLFAQDGPGTALVGPATAAIVEAGAAAIEHRMGINDVKAPADPPVATGAPAPQPQTA